MSKGRFANVWGYFAATYALGWLIWLVAILLPTDSPRLGLVVLGAFVPSTMGVLFTYLTEGQGGRRDLWMRTFDVRRIGLRWLAVICVVFPVLHLASALLYGALGGDPPALATVLERAVDPVVLMQLVVANLLISGFSEELGWRGYALDQLQARWNALTASLVLGFLHAFWHTPLFLIPGIMQGEMGLFSVDYLIFIVGVTAGAVLVTWVYNHTGRSILSAILLHFWSNTVGNLITGLHGTAPTGYNALFACLLIVLATALVAGWGAGTLMERRQAARPQRHAREV
jgi:membrane protease YdiL (CAAX protease family)